MTEFEIKNGFLVKCSGADEEVIIPDCVTAIESNAFKDQVNLKRVVIPKTVIVINQKAFWGCKNLTAYCEAEIKPSGWSGFWNLYHYDEVEWWHDYQHPGQGTEIRRMNYEYLPVEWGYKK